METLPPFSLQARQLKPGIYRHSKGKEYAVLSVGRNEENLQEVVIYRALYGDEGVWVRTVDKFVEPVEWPDGKKAPRFQFVREG